MKKYRKNMTHRIPARAAAETRHLTARSGLEVMLYELLQHALVQKERRNDLPELTPQRNNCDIAYIKQVLPDDETPRILIFAIFNN